MSKLSVTKKIGLFGFIFSSFSAFSNNAEVANKSNNPLNPSPGLNAQNYYTSDIYGTDKYTNDFLLRGTLPVLPNDFVAVPQLFRLTVPVSTRPDASDDYTTGLGDINLFDIFLFKAGSMQIGAGPLITAPTASDDELGTGKWQAGLAAVIVDPAPKRLLGALLQWQQSFAGDDDREDVGSVTFQPFGIFNLPEGWYVRSTGIWSFNIENGNYYIPVGLGAGKVWKMDSTILNFYIEPQWTVSHSGAGEPKFTTLGGFNLTF
ncbi:hypothetical protein Q4491_06865 [Photobacterium sp. 2_MG-2023]|uniref:hypothetical protein n=1 Tax=unclassified Photobacterium TaxID=2628852 RepID=UPI001C47C521|nr:MULTISPECIES: hypothetical protein [unclassified Photobacterium]MBV7261848.1 hypothetical protein [Photobacterium sp. WH24]MDO6581066.1 hypothetical protein [Photobacterium sp. 2_MG-2023]